MMKCFVVHLASATAGAHYRWCALIKFFISGASCFVSPHASFIIACVCGFLSDAIVCTLIAYSSCCFLRARCLRSCAFHHLCRLLFRLLTSQFFGTLWRRQEPVKIMCKCFLKSYEMMTTMTSFVSLAIQKSAMPLPVFLVTCLIVLMKAK